MSVVRAMMDLARKLTAWEYVGRYPGTRITGGKGIEKVRGSLTATIRDRSAASHPRHCGPWNMVCY